MLDDALKLYKSRIYDESLNGLFGEHGFSISGSVSPMIWELFCSILFDAPANSSGTSHDLNGYEVKSATIGNNFEYQYHSNSGLDKLSKEGFVSHVYCLYSSDYKTAQVYLVPGTVIYHSYLKDWIALYSDHLNQNKDAKNVRFRKRIPSKFVVSKGLLVLSIEGGRVIDVDERLLSLHVDEGVLIA